VTISDSLGDEARPTFYSRRLRTIAATKGVTVQTYVDGLVAVLTSECNYVAIALSVLEEERSFWLSLEFGPNVKPKTIRRRARKIERFGAAIDALKAVAP